MKIIKGKYYICIILYLCLNLLGEVKKKVMDLNGK